MKVKLATPHDTRTGVGHGCGNNPCPNLITAKVSTKAIAAAVHANGPSLLKMSFESDSMNS